MKLLTEIDDPFTEWRLYVPRASVERLRSAENLVATYASRLEALDAARKFAGSALIEETIVKTTRTAQWPGV